LKQTRSAKDERLEELETKLQRAEDKIYLMELELRNCGAARDQLLKDSADLKGQNSYLKNINQQLLENTKQLRQDLNKKKSVIQLQGKVIQLLDDTKKTIETSLKEQIAAQEIEVVEEDDKLKVIFVDRILFDSGSAKVSDRGMSLLQVMAESLKDSKEQDIVVEGHTDDVPISPALQQRFPSNWELSTARAAAVVRFLQEQAGIKPERLSARGYSYYRPVAPNTTEAGRQQNRRIEIILGWDN
jgi:chemotaxis protein MotB